MWQQKHLKQNEAASAEAPEAVGVEEPAIVESPESPVAEDDLIGLSDSQIEDLLDDSDESGQTEEAPTAEVDDDVAPKVATDKPKVAEGETGEQAAEETAEIETKAPETPESEPEKPKTVETKSEESEQVKETPAEFAARRAQLREQTVQQLTEQYSLSEDDALTLQTEPEKILPTIAANLHVQVFEQVMATIQRTMPGMVQRVQTQSAENEKQVNAFHTRWPQLVDHKDTVLRVGQIYRGLNPDASAEKAIEEIGAMAMFQLGLNPQEAVSEDTQPVSMKPPTPAAPAARSAPPAAPKPGEGNIFAELAEDFEREDRG